MEITEIRQRDALLRLSGAGDVLSESLEIATQAWSDNNALTNEAEQRYQTLESRFQILKNNMSDFGISIYDSLRDPLKSTVEQSIGYVQRLHDAFNKGGLHGVVKELGSVFEDVADNIAGTGDAAAGIITPIKNIVKAGGNLAKSVLPPLAKGFKLLAENMDALVPAIAAGTAGYKAFNAIGKATAVTVKANAAATAVLNKMEKANALQLVATNGGLTTRQAILAVHNGQITATTALTGLWTKAQTALNTAMAANPIGVAITAVAALTAGLAALDAVIGDAIEETYRLSKSQRDSLEALNEHTEALNDQRLAREDNVASIDREYSGYESLLSELQSITDANGQVTEGYEDRARVITGQLSDALGTEISMQDGVIQKYDETIGAIKELIVQKKAEALMSAMQDDMAQAYENSRKAIDEYKNAQEALEEQQKKVIEAEEAYIKGGPKHKQALDQAKEDQEELEKALQNSKTAMEDLASEVNNYDAMIEARASGDIAQIEEAMNALVTSYRSYSSEALRASEETRKEMYAQANGYVEEMRTVQDGSVAVAESVYQEMARAASNSIQEFNKLPGGIAQGIQEIGPEAGAAMLAALSQADLDGKLDAEGQQSLKALTEQFALIAPQTAEELSKVPPEAVAALVAGNMKGELSEEAKGAVEGMLKEFDGMDEETQMLFAQTIYGALAGLEGFDKIADPAEEGVTTFLKTLIEELAVHSPSRAVEKIFNNVWPGANEGLEEGQEGLFEKGKGVIEGFLTSIGGEELFERVKGIGSTIMSFFGIGVESQKGGIDGSAKGISDSLNMNLGAADTQTTGGQKAQEYNSGIGSLKGAIDTTSKVIADSSNTIFGSADTQGTGSRKALEYDQGINSQKGIIDLDSKAISDSSNANLGSANTWGTGSRKGSEYDRGLGSKSGAINATSVGLSNTADAGMGSSDTGATGVEQGAEYAEGVGSQADNANVQGTSLSDEANSGASSADGYTPGSDFGSGFVRGIGAWLGDAARAAASLATRAYNALRSALEERSPSRKTKRSGKNFDLGLAVGVEKNKKYAVAAAEGLAEDTLDALDMSQVRDKMENIDIPETMSRVYMAVEGRKEKIASKMSSSIEARENAKWKGLEREEDVHLSKEDIRKLAGEFARAASAAMANELDGMGMYSNDRELFRMVREAGRR